MAAPCRARLVWFRGGQRVGGHELISARALLTGAPVWAHTNHTRFTALLIGHRFIDAPRLCNRHCVFKNANQAIVYFEAGTTGWTDTFGGRPAKLWDPLTLPRATNFGVKSGQFGFNVTGTSGLLFVVEAPTDLVQPVWTPVSTTPSLRARPPSALRSGRIIPAASIASECHEAEERWRAGAQFNLGNRYYLGHGVEEYSAEAYAWFNLAASSRTREALDQDLRGMVVVVDARRNWGGWSDALRQAQGRRPVRPNASRMPHNRV